MIITKLKTNRITNPLGFTLDDRPRLSYIVTDTDPRDWSQKAVAGAF